jgi:hypothetical protein
MVSAVAGVDCLKVEIAGVGVGARCGCIRIDTPRHRLEVGIHEFNCSLNGTVIGSGARFRMSLFVLRLRFGHCVGKTGTDH